MVDFTVNKLQEIIARPQPVLVQQHYDFHNDVRVLGLTLDGEGRNQSIDGRLAIGWTVKNRHERYPADKGKRYSTICLRRLQYSCWWEAGGPLNFERQMLMASHVFTGAVISNWSAKVLNESLYLAQGLIQDKFALDPTKGATHYMTTELFESNKRPKWADPSKRTIVIGDHVFFAGIA